MLINFQTGDKDRLKQAEEASNRYLSMKIEPIIKTIIKNDNHFIINILIGTEAVDDRYRFSIRRCTPGKPDKTNGIRRIEAELITIATGIPWDTIRHYWHTLPDIYIGYNAKSGNTFITHEKR